MIVKRRYVVILILFAFSILVMNAKPQDRNSVAYTLLAQGENVIPEKRNIQIEFFTTRRAFEAFHRKIHKGIIPRPDPPSVDFTESAVLYVSYGEQKSAGYSIDVRSIFKKNSSLIVKAVLISPPQDAFTAQVITYPYVILTVPAADYRRVELMNEIGEVLDFKNL